MNIRQQGSKSHLMRNKVVVVGSYNIDLMIKTPKIPQPGETVIGGSFSKSHGGKGANQAVAAARAGAEVCFIGCVGADSSGEEAIKQLQQNNINVDYLKIDETEPTGAAFIIVNEAGENCIVVASGANAQLLPRDVEAAKAAIAAADVLLLQLESPLETVEAAVRIAAANGVNVILNPAPAQPLNSEWLKLVSIITPNEIEAEMLTGLKNNSEAQLREAARRLICAGIGVVVVTCGKDGEFVATCDRQFAMPAFKIEAIDTTGAGDVFNGAFAAVYRGIDSLEQVVKFASAASALSVTKLGAQTSAPVLENILKFMAEYRVTAI